MLSLSKIRTLFKSSQSNMTFNGQAVDMSYVSTHMDKYTLSSPTESVSSLVVNGKHEKDSFQLVLFYVPGNKNLCGGYTFTEKGVRSSGSLSIKDVSLNEFVALAHKKLSERDADGADLDPLIYVSTKKKDFD